MNNEINDYIFNKNKFSLKKPSESLINKDLNYCKKYSIENKKAGFHFYGNNNLCYLYKNSKPSQKFENDLNQYTIKKFTKNKKQKNARLNEQNNNNFYFAELNHFNMASTGLIKKSNVENVNKCMNSCLNTPGCNSVTYFEEPNKCNFYDEIHLGSNKNKKYDTYTISNSTLINNDLHLYKLNQNEKINENKNENLNINININEKSNINKNLNKKKHNNTQINTEKYTSCFTNQNFNHYNDLINHYNQICKNDLGQEYVFANNNNHLNIQKCDNDDKIKILCKPVFNEYFTNQESNESNNNKLNYNKLNYNKNNIKYIIGIIFILIIMIVLLNLFHIIKLKKYKFYFIKK
jgi:hypothetical protein